MKTAEDFGLPIHKRREVILHRGDKLRGVIEARPRHDTHLVRKVSLHTHGFKFESLKYVLDLADHHFKQIENISCGLLTIAEHRWGLARQNFFQKWLDAIDHHELVPDNHMLVAKVEIARPGHPVGPGNIIDIMEILADYEASIANSDPYLDFGQLAVEKCVNGPKGAVLVDIQPLIIAKLPPELLL